MKGWTKWRFDIKWINVKGSGMMLIECEDLDTSGGNLELGREGALSLLQSHCHGSWQAHLSWSSPLYCTMYTSHSRHNTRRPPIHLTCLYYTINSMCASTNLPSVYNTTNLYCLHTESLIFFISCFEHLFTTYANKSDIYFYVCTCPVLQ